MKKHLLFGVALFASTQAAAFTFGGTSVTFQPASPVHGQPVSVVATELDGTCLDFSVGLHLDIEARKIVIGLSGYDYVMTPCEPYRLSPRTIDLGPLPGGTYDVLYIGCSFNAPPGDPPCNDLATETLTVLGGPPATVPATSPWALLLLAALLGWATRFRRPAIR